MRRTATLLFSVFLTVILSVGLVGCDDSPTSVEDFEIQPNVEVSESSLSLALTSAESTTSFEVSYQGLESAPTAQGTGVLSLTKTSENGSPESGKQMWSVGADGSVSGIVEESVIVRSPTKDKEIVDTLSVTVSPFSVTSEFSAGFISVADYEDAQRDSSGTGGTTITLQRSDNGSNNPAGTNGAAYLEIDASGSGAAVFQRRASAPNSDRFTFLVKPADTDFDLTLTFTEETGSGTTDHQITVPVNAGNEWLKYGIAFSQIGADFDPVAQRAGGNGPLAKVELSASKDVTYSVDELLLGTANASQVEIMDFERTTLAYGPPFCPPSFSNTNNVAPESDGFTAQSIEGGGCFGYNYSNLYPAVSGDDVVSVRASASEGDSLFVAVEGNDGAGGYTYGAGVTVALPTGGWGVVEIPFSALGDSPGALKDAGVSNVGFEARGADPDFVIDDIKIKAASGN